MQKFKKVYTLSQVANDPRVDSISDERGMGDGLWIYLKNPYVNDFLETTFIHEHKVSDIIDQLNNSVVTADQLPSFVPNPWEN